MDLRKGNMAKYTTFCGGINGDVASKSKKKKSFNILLTEYIYKRSVERSGTSVLYIGCVVPKG